MVEIHRFKFPGLKVMIKFVFTSPMLLLFSLCANFNCSCSPVHTPIKSRAAHGECRNNPISCKKRVPLPLRALVKYCFISMYMYHSFSKSSWGISVIFTDRGLRFSRTFATFLKDIIREKQIFLSCSLKQRKIYYKMWFMWWLQ